MANSYTHKKVRVGETNNKRSTQCVLRTLHTCAPNASERGTKSQVAHKWAQWQDNPCRLGDTQRFRVGDKISTRPQVGRLAT